MAKRPDPATLSPAQLAAILDRIPGIRAWCSQVEGHALDLLLRSKKVPGYKLVAGRSNRIWANPKSAAAQLKKAGMTDDELWTKELVSVSVAEKHLGKKKFAKLSKLVEKPPGKPALAPADDPRAPIDPAEMFDDE